MTKAILVLNMPKCCEDCLIFNKSEMLCCGRKVNIQEITTRPNWCPLRELPKRLDNEYYRGWNDCLGEIVGDW